MKKYFLTLAIVFASSLAALAQSTSPVSTTVENDDMLYSAYQWSLDIPQDHVEDKLEEFVKNNYDVRLKGGGLFGGDSYTAPAVDIGGFDTTVDLYARIYTVGEQEKTTELIWWTNATDKSEQANKALLAEMERFVASFAPLYYTKQKQDAIDEISKVDKDLDGLKKDVEKKSGKISKLEASMRKLDEKKSGLEADKKELLAEQNKLKEEQNKKRAKKEKLTNRLDKVNRNLR